MPYKVSSSLGKSLKNFRYLRCIHRELPIPLARARVNFQYKFLYDSQKKEKNTFRNTLEATDAVISDKIFLINAYALKVIFHMGEHNRLKLHCRTPDLSNLLKFVEDSLNKITWEDDCRISYVEMEKRYSDKEETEFEILKIDPRKELSLPWAEMRENAVSIDKL